MLLIQTNHDLLNDLKQHADLLGWDTNYALSGKRLVFASRSPRSHDGNAYPTIRIALDTQTFRIWFDSTSTKYSLLDDYVLTAVMVIRRTFIEHGYL